MNDSKGHILVTGEHVKTELLLPIEEAGYGLHIVKDLLSEEMLTKELTGCIGYVFGGDEYASAKALGAADKLKVISVLAVGYESFLDVPTAKQRDIRITNTPGANTNAVAEFTVGHLLNGIRKIGFYSETYRKRGAGGERKSSELRASKIGLVGLGAIGTRIAEILVYGFGCEVIYYSRTRKQDVEDRLGLKYASLDDMMSQIDCLITMPAGNASTVDLINESHIENLRHPIVLVNTCRPSVVSSKALLSGLENGLIATACYDAFYPSSDTNYIQLMRFKADKLAITGHIAWLTHNACDTMTKMAVESLLNVLATGNDKHLVA